MWLTVYTVQKLGGLSESRLQLPFDGPMCRLRNADQLFSHAHLIVPGGIQPSANTQARLVHPRQCDPRGLFLAVSSQFLLDFCMLHLPYSMSYELPLKYSPPKVHG